MELRHLKVQDLNPCAQYLVVTANYEARAAGVGKLMRTDEALRKCPGLVLVRGWGAKTLCSRRLAKCGNTGINVVLPSPALDGALVGRRGWTCMQAGLACGACLHGTVFC